MKKKIVWFTAAVAAFGLYASAEVVITSPTGTPDESDVALEKAVDALKELPRETVEVIGDTFHFVADEVRNTTHGIKSVFKGGSPREIIREEMFSEVAGAWDVVGEIIFRSYSVTPALAGELTPADVSEGEAVDVSAFFKDVEFPEDTGAYFWPDSSELLVRNTRDRLMQVETSLGLYYRAARDYKQVEINAKFIEVSQSTLNQLGFTWRIEDVAGADGVRLFDDWKIGDNQDILSAGLRTAAGAFGGIPAAGSMVLTKGGWMPLSLTIDALEQASDSDVLSSPSITTKDGNTAKIWVGEDRMVPERFEVNAVSVNVHIQHVDWDSELMGVYFEVTPEILEDNIIRLELNPKIVGLLGYDTYQVSPEATMMMINGYSPEQQRVDGTYPIIKYAEDGITGVWQSLSDTMSAVFGSNTDPNDMSTVNTNATSSGGAPYYSYKDMHRKANHDEFATSLAANYGSLPYFRVREIETTVDVADGSTVGLGGLIYDRLETYKDKVPVLGSIPLLGRLFRSEGERSIKRNLMIFVTATQVEDNGRRKSDLVVNN